MILRKTSLPCAPTATDSFTPEHPAWVRIGALQNTSFEKGGEHHPTELRCSELFWGQFFNMCPDDNLRWASRAHLLQIGYREP